MQATSQTLRIFCDETSRSAVLDANTGATPQAWARAATTFQLGLASLATIVDVGNLASVTLEASPYATRDAARLISVTLPASSLDDTTTQATWASGAQQHALINLTSAQMNFLTAGLTSADFWLVVSAITTAGAPIVFGTGKLTVNDPGTFFTASTPPANPGAYLTIDQAQAMFASAAALASLAQAVAQLQAAAGATPPTADSATITSDQSFITADTN